MSTKSTLPVGNRGNTSMQSPWMMVLRARPLEGVAATVRAAGAAGCVVRNVAMSVFMAEISCG